MLASSSALWILDHIRSHGSSCSRRRQSLSDACSIVQISMCALALQVSLDEICMTVHTVPSFHNVWRQHTRRVLVHSRLLTLSSIQGYSSVCLNMQDGVVAMLLGSRVGCAIQESLPVNFFIGRIHQRAITLQLMLRGSRGHICTGLASCNSALRAAHKC